MTGPPRDVRNRPAVDLLVRVIAIALLVLLIFVGLPILAELAG